MAIFLVLLFLFRAQCLRFAGIKEHSCGCVFGIAALKGISMRLIGVFISVTRCFKGAATSAMRRFELLSLVTEISSSFLVAQNINKAFNARF